MNSSQAVPSYGSQVTVLSQSAKNAAKSARKERKREAKKDKDWDLPFAALFEFDEKYGLEKEVAANSYFPGQQELKKVVTYPHVYDHSSGGSILSGFGTRYKLPARAERQDEKVVLITQISGL